MEFVWVVRRTDLFPIAYPHGFLHRDAADPAGRTEELLDRIRARAFYLERRFAEQDPSFKQIIPYCLVMTESGCLRLERHAAQGEQRLHHLLSVGVGGHINPVDAGAGGDPLEAGTRRELEEEIQIEGSFDIDLIGTINDDTTPVGAVHFGVVYRVRASEGSVRVRENEKMSGEIVSPESLVEEHRADPQRFESWSSFLIEQLDHILHPDPL